MGAISSKTGEFVYEIKEKYFTQYDTVDFIKSLIQKHPKYILIIGILIAFKISKLFDPLKVPKFISWIK